MTEKTPSSMKALSREVDAVGRRDFYSVPLEEFVVEEGFNLREESPELHEHIESIAKSFERGETIPPLFCRVQNGKVTIVDGHCRHRGALLAKQRNPDLNISLPVIEFKGNDVQRIKLMMRSAEGKALTPLEIAKGYERLINHGYTSQQIADEMGKTNNHVLDYLTLASSNHNVHKLVRDGSVSATTAIQAVKQHGEDAGDLLGSKLAESVAVGRTKVTSSQVRGWAPQRSHAIKIYERTESMLSQLSTESMRSITEVKAALDNGMSPDQIETTVTLKATNLLELLEAFKESQDAKNRKEQRLTEQKTLGNQQELPDLEP